MRSGNYLQFQTILRRNTQEFSGFNTRPLSPGEYDIRLNVSWIFKMATADSFRNTNHYWGNAAAPGTSSGAGMLLVGSPFGDFSKAEYWKQR
ncbi:hypothetical protein AVEN_27528-1 [Araneus ventricosus]|uniref:Uncharacterized protein n=1 Tax=Araneus ventricosus TaxID=182803 RepID=A0A4Y2JC08_ARAVE|nr:hypothetical protein AVEN_27528-1 [Araneus ventricosus]